jgi:Mrp family chromosome partitioning ATPase/predicted Fe-Mo cluster-binding NifX family protein
MSDEPGKTGESCSSCGGQDRALEMQAQEKALEQRMSRVKHKIMVLSGKGGVGKSTVAANLAHALSLKGFHVGLLDVDVHGPSIPLMLGIEDRPVMGDDGRIVPVGVGPHLRVMSMGFFLRHRDDALIWRGPLKATLIRQFLSDVEWGDLDYLIVDSPPGTGDEPLSVGQLIPDADGAVIVTTPQEIALADVRKSVNFCRKMGLHILGVVENMSGFVCPHCGERADIFKTGGGEAMAAEMGIPFLGRIPLDPGVVSHGDEGTLASGETIRPETRAGFDELADTVLAREKPRTPETTQHFESREVETMRIAIPLADGKLAQHFGHCQEFALVDVDAASKEIVKQVRLEPPAHQPGVLPKWLGEQGADKIICGGMGSRAQGLFRSQGIEVVIGAPSVDPESIVNEFLEGTLVTGENICDH